ncbi:MAG: ArsR family transcriptional regulator [Gemmatimonadales bacterium]|nr:MAG: ArsR family transcriptional regulator [Gemmatimonadales bacterium]
MSDELMSLVAERFRALGEPARLRILELLRSGERPVGDIARETELGTANVSKHLGLLHRLGFVARRKDGIYVHYRLADDHVFRLCDLMCGKVEIDARRKVEALLGEAEA